MVYQIIENVTPKELREVGLGFLRGREVVHFQKFGEVLMNVEDKLSGRTIINNL